MKQIIIFLLLIVVFLIGFGKYNEYKRYNSPQIDYKSTKKIDLDYHNQELVINYHKAIEDLNSFVIYQWTTNSIDVRKPENDNEQTKLAVTKYADKLGIIKYYETKLENSNTLKKQGFSNKEIKILEETGKTANEHISSQKIIKIKSMFNTSKKLLFGGSSSLIFEIQKQLIKKGFKIKLDGVYKIETAKAIKQFETENNLFADGYLDILTLDAIFEK